MSSLHPFGLSLSKPGSAAPYNVPRIASSLSMSTTNSLDVLIQALRRLPGVGVKSAQRMAFHLLQHDRAGALALSRALEDAVGSVHHCTLCHTFTEAEVCSTCLDPERDATRLCVVETPADQSALERTGAFKGLYFVLMGRLSPLDGIGP